MSNRQKGLMPNVKWILHDTFHSFCMKHMESNLKVAFKDDYLVGLLWKAVFTCRHVEYKETKDKMKAHNQNMIQLLKDRKATHLSHARFPMN